MRCGEQPPDPEWGTCHLSASRHADHVDKDGHLWSDQRRIDMAQRVATPSRKRSDRQKAASMVAGVRPFQHSDPVATSEIRGGWTIDEWVEYAGRIFYQFLLARPEPFTTAEDFWPLVEKPEEMRHFRRVVQSHLKAGHMEEVGSKRLRDTYRTKDGHEFPMNKLVPIYQSRIHRPEG